MHKKKPKNSNHQKSKLKVTTSKDKYNYVLFDLRIYFVARSDENIPGTEHSLVTLNL